MSKLRTLRELLDSNLETYKRDLSEDEAQLFVMIHEKEFIPTKGSELMNYAIEINVENREMPTQIEAIIKRLVVMAPNILFDIGTITLAGYLCKSFGDCTIWAHTLAIETKQTKFDCISINEFAKLFPFGVPNDRAYDTLWQEQKHENKNLLDNAQYYL